MKNDFDSSSSNGNGAEPIADSKSAKLESSGKPLPKLYSRASVPLDIEDDGSVIAQAKNLWKQQRSKYRRQTKGFTWYDWAGYFIPCLTWLKKYNVRAWLLADLIAGLSVGSMVIPQGISYANLAGLPPVYGLYGAFVPCIVYALLGSSRQLAVGPVAVTSILLGNGLENIFSTSESPCLIKSTCDASSGDGSEPPATENGATCNDFSRAAIQVAFLAGIMYTSVGLLSMGWITYFLSHATISGFMSGAAIIIAFSQVKYILGLSIPRADNLHEQLKLIFQNLDQFSWREFVMGVSFMLVLILFRFLSRKYRRLGFLRSVGPLTVSVISIALMNIFGWYEASEPCGKPPIKPIGDIPTGFPSVTVSWWFPLYNVGRQILLAVIICFIDISESMSIAKALAAKNKYKLHANQELRGLGIANLAGAMFNAYTTTGSFSRSAVNDSVGAKTPLSGFVTGILVMFTLLFVAGVFENMSQNVMAAIVIVGVIPLIQWQECIRLWKISKRDWLIWIFTFIFTLFLGVEIGILVGVALSVVLVLYRTAFPRIAKLGRLPGTNIFRNAFMYPDAEPLEGILVLRIDAPIFFANVEGIQEYLQEQLEQGKAEQIRRGAPVRFVIIDMSPSPDIDIAGVHLLEDLIVQLRGERADLILANPSRSVLLLLRRSGLLKKLGPGGVQVSVGEAVKYATTLMEGEAAAAMSSVL